VVTAVVGRIASLPKIKVVVGIHLARDPDLDLMVRGTVRTAAG
jgi:hypothetical protein